MHDMSHSGQIMLDLEWNSGEGVTLILVSACWGLHGDIGRALGQIQMDEQGHRATKGPVLRGHKYWRGINVKK